MTFRQLKYFSVIYECKSLARASQKLYISQQGLSRILGSLESEIGPLFVRLHNGLAPTPFGSMVYEACQPVLAEMNRLEKSIVDFSRQVSQQLGIGLVGGTRYLNAISMRSIWQGMQTRYPHVQLQAQELSYADGLRLLTEEKMDLVTYSDYKAGAGYTQIPLRTWERVLLVPQGHPLYGETQVSPGVMKNEHIILYMNSHAYQHFLEYCKKNDCLPAEIVRLSDTLYMYDACQKECCLGLTIHDYYTTPLLPQFSALRTIPFTENFLPYTVSALFRAHHPMANVLADLSNELKRFFQTL